MGRAISVNELLTRTRRVMAFDGRFEASFGRPELTGSWMIWGGSGSGKTRFSVQLAKYLTRFGRVAYNSLEEGDSESLRRAFAAEGMQEVARKIIVISEPMSELASRLAKKKGPDIVIIDSFQYTGMTYAEYRDFRQKHRSKLLVFISHADGKEPAGKAARSVRYDSFVKVFVKGYKAFPVSRYGGGEPFVIWPEKAGEYWGETD